MLDGQATSSDLGQLVGRLGRTNAFLPFPKPLSSPFSKREKSRLSPSESQHRLSLAELPGDHVVPFPHHLPSSPPNFRAVLLSPVNEESVC